MAAIVMGTRVGSWLVSEANAWRSRDERPVAIPAGGLKTGTVLKAGATAADPLVPVTAAADTPVGVLLVETVRQDEAAAENQVLTIISRDAEVFGPGLAWPEGMTVQDQQTLGNKLVSETGLVVRWK